MVAWTDAEARTLREKVEVLNGDRGDRTRRALRVGEMANLQELLAALRRGATELDSRIGVIASNVQTAEGDVAALDAALAALDGTVLGFDAALTAVYDSLGTLNVVVTNQGNAAAALTTRVTAAESAIGDADTAATALALRVTATEGDIEDIQTAVGAVVAATITATTIAGAPTAADYNKVVDDIAALRTMLLAMQAGII